MSGRNIESACRLIGFLRNAKEPMNATLISAAVEMDHAAVLRWLYTLNESGLVDVYVTHPRKWRWKQ